MSITLITLLLSPQLTPTSSLQAQAPTTQTLYVGGNGPGNYTTIQEAIDAAAPNDTIYIYHDHAPYYEHLTITKPLTLQGENKETTIIDGNNTDNVITINADHCIITGITVQHSGANTMVDANIKLTTTQTTIYDTIIQKSGNFTLGIFFNNSHNNTVYNNTFFKNGNEGVYLVNSSHILITNNLFIQNRHCGVIISKSTQNRVTRNTMTGNMAGVSIWPDSTYNLVDNNTITDGLFSGIGLWWHAEHNDIHDNRLNNNSQYGIVLTSANYTTISRNEISASSQGIVLHSSHVNSISANDFLNNTQDAFFENSTRTRWQGNYWSSHHFGLPVLIHGTRLVPWKDTPVGWLNVDWRPATKPNLGYTLSTIFRT
jgi:parallel beta-helix repeat protein